MANQLKTACFAAITATCFSINIQAAIINFTVTGNVDDSFTSTNDFGLNLGDTITASGTFDDSGLTGTGAEFVSFGSGSFNSMSLDVGNSSFVETDDNNYLTGFPRLFFQDGVFDGINFNTDFSIESYFQSSGTTKTFQGEDDNFGWFGGSWDVSSYSASPVPVPAAVWLFGSGLLGLIGVARRKH